MGMTGPEPGAKISPQSPSERASYVGHGDCVSAGALNPAGVQTLIHKCMATPAPVQTFMQPPPSHSVDICGSSSMFRSL